MNLQSNTSGARRRASNAPARLKLTHGLMLRNLAPDTGQPAKCTRRLCAPHLIAAKAEASPNAVALSEGSAQLTYGELDARANQLAAFLRSLGVGPDAPVGISLDRSFDYVIATLAVWKAGGAYLPLDPEWPPDLREFILEDAQAPVLITRSVLDSKARYVVDLDANAGVIAREQVVCPDLDIKRDNLAYIVYTVGDTGEPEGIEVTHGNLLNLIFWHRRVFGIIAEDRASHLAGLASSNVAWELWPYLTAGASIALADCTVRTSPELLREWIVAREITVAFVPTALAEPMLTAPWPRHCNLRFLLTGGDTLHRYPAPDLPFIVINNYGPAECTVIATSGAVRPVSSDRTLPAIGAPITNTHIYLLDGNRQPVPRGTVGEIYIGGAGVARGYRNLPSLTAEKFVPDPFVKASSSAPDARMYRTGDLGCLLPDGQIAFRGRLNRKEETLGPRIEPDEIASVLQRHPCVASCAVATISDPQGRKRLAAYVVANQHACTRQLDSAELREFLAHRLPDFMVPEVFVGLDELPLTWNGKVDRAALPEPSSIGLSAVSGLSVPPRLV